MDPRNDIVDLLQEEYKFNRSSWMKSITVGRVTFGARGENVCFYLEGYPLTPKYVSGDYRTDLLTLIERESSKRFVINEAGVKFEGSAEFERVKDLYKKTKWKHPLAPIEFNFIKDICDLTENHIELSDERWQSDIRIQGMYKKLLEINRSI